MFKEHIESALRQIQTRSATIGALRSNMDLPLPMPLQYALIHKTHAISSNYCVGPYYTLKLPQQILQHKILELAHVDLYFAQEARVEIAKQLFFVFCGIISTVPGFYKNIGDHLEPHRAEKHVGIDP